MSSSQLALQASDRGNIEDHTKPISKCLSETLHPLGFFAYLTVTDPHLINETRISDIIIHHSGKCNAQQISLPEIISSLSIES